MGPHIEKEHCFIQNLEGIVTLVPSLGAMCAVQGIEVTEPTKLSQGKLLVTVNLSFVLNMHAYMQLRGLGDDT